MENGGPARLTEEYGGGEAGTGAGVKIPFTYNGFGLDELGKIAQVHIKATWRRNGCQQRWNARHRCVRVHCIRQAVAVRRDVRDDV